MDGSELNKVLGGLSECVKDLKETILAMGFSDASRWEDVLSNFTAVNARLLQLSLRGVDPIMQYFAEFPQAATETPQQIPNVLSTMLLPEVQQSHTQAIEEWQDASGGVVESVELLHKRIEEFNSACSNIEVDFRAKKDRVLKQMASVRGLASMVDAGTTQDSTQGRSRKRRAQEETTIAAIAVALGGKGLPHYPPEQPPAAVPMQTHFKRQRTAAPGANGGGSSGAHGSGSGSGGGLLSVARTYHGKPQAAPAPRRS